MYIFCVHHSCLAMGLPFAQVIEEMTRNGCEVTSDRAQSCPSLRRAIAEMQGRQQSEKDLGVSWQF